MTTVAAAAGADRLGEVVALTDGYAAAFVGAAVVAGAGALATLALFRGTTVAGAAADEPAARVG